MSMELTLVDKHKRPVPGPYVIRLAGWTLERYLEEAPEDRIWEFVREEVVMHSPATAEHQRLVGFVYKLLSGYCEAKRWGEVLTGPAAVQVLPDVVREPDLFVLPPQELPKATGTPLNVHLALVVEVVSPSTRTIDLKEKPQDYAQAGIGEYWAVDAERKEITVHRLEARRYEVERLSGGTVQCRAVPGLWLQADWLFQDRLPAAAECLQAVLGS